MILQIIFGLTHGSLSIWLRFSRRMIVKVLPTNEDVIVGLQTDEPLKRACKPRGGFQLVASALKSYGYQPCPEMAKTYSDVSSSHRVALVL